MGQVEIVDVERAVMTWLNADGALCGPGQPVANGFHTGSVRSPSQGAIGTVRVGTGGVSDALDQRRVILTVQSVGKAGPETRGPRWEAERGARAAAVKFFALDRPARVVLDDGSVVVLKHVDPETAQGPTLIGDQGGEITYALDAVVSAQVGT